MTKRQRAFLKHLEESKGIVTTAARAAGIDPSTHYKWLRGDQEYKEAVEKIQDSAGDFVEGKLLELIEKGNVTAVIFYCKTRLKQRGYIERVEQKVNFDSNTPVVSEESVRALLDKMDEIGGNL